MPRRKSPTERGGYRPLIRIERIAYEKITFKLSTTLLKHLAAYAQYVQEMTGDEPSPDELIEKGMQRLFEADRGFKQWLQQRESGTRSVGRTEAGLSGGKGEARQEA